MVKKNIKLLVLTLIPFFVTSCIIYATGIFDQKLKIKKQNYKGNEIRLDGFYYTEYYKDHFKIVFLYSNGIFIDYSAGYNYNDILNSNNLRFILNYKKTPMYMYGLFQINDSIIKIEKWLPSSGGPTKAYLREGKILNDTTFYLMHREKKEIFRFKQFSTKPDSTNRFIK